MGVGRPCPPVRNGIVTPRHLFARSPYFSALNSNMSITKAYGYVQTLKITPLRDDKTTLFSNITWRQSYWNERKISSKFCRFKIRKLHANHCIFWQRLHNFIPWFVNPLVCQSIHSLVHHIALFWRFFSLRLQGSFPNTLMNSNTAPALPHTNRVAMFTVYAFFFHLFIYFFRFCF